MFVVLHERINHGLDIPAAGSRLRRIRATFRGEFARPPRAPPPCAPGPAALTLSSHPSASHSVNMSVSKMWGSFQEAVEKTPRTMTKLTGEQAATLTCLLCGHDEFGEGSKGWGIR